MIVAAALLLAAAAAPPPRDPADAPRYRACLDSAGTEPASAIVEATRWLGSGGGVPARHCLALAYLAQRQWGAAVQALDAAARAGEAMRDPLVPELWGQAGNAALAGGRADAALGYLTSALTAAADDAARAPYLIDRARAFVELKRDAEARADLDRAVRLAPGSADAWLLRATLARRTGDLAAAEASLLAAVKLDADGADVSLEAGNIAAAQGRIDLARAAWEAAAAAAPDAPAGIAAAQALRLNAAGSAGTTAPGPRATP